MAARIAFLLFGIFLFGPGSGYYIGAGLGPRPRDGLMTGLAKRGHPVRTVRTGIELAALATRAALGGTVGVGTVVFALAGGTTVHFFLPRMHNGIATCVERVGRNVEIRVGAQPLK